METLRLNNLQAVLNLSIGKKYVFNIFWQLKCIKIVAKIIIGGN